MAEANPHNFRKNLPICMQISSKKVRARFHVLHTYDFSFNFSSERNDIAMYFDLQHLAIISLAGLAVGLFLVTLIKTVPIRLHQEWRQQIFEANHQFENGLNPTDYTLSTLEKLSFLAVSLVVTFSTYLKFGLDKENLFIYLYLQSLLLLCVINLKHKILPDSVVLVTLWLGLLSQVITGGNSTDGIYGAVIGYLAPFALVMVTKAVTGKMAMGLGDIKCFAMAGGCLGYKSLPDIFTFFIFTLIAQAIILGLLKRTEPNPTGIPHLVASYAIVFGLGVF
jgi:leader peptidase (prepilin peptidase) / N-methyltransferase